MVLRTFRVRVIRVQFPTLRQIWCGARVRSPSSISDIPTLENSTNSRFNIYKNENQKNSSPLS